MAPPSDGGRVKARPSSIGRSGKAGVVEQLARAAETGDLDFISSEIRQRRARWDPEFTLQILGRSKPQHPAVKCDRRNFPLAPRRPASELRETPGGLIRVGGGDPQCQQRQRAVRVVEMALGPHQLLGVVG